MTTRYKITIAYDGTAFHGWQRQPEVLTVQEYLEDILKVVLREDITLHGSGRTDAGVHAKGQVAHMDCETEVNSYTLIQAMNYFGRGKGVSILNIEKVSTDFHARYCGKSRTYHYYILNRDAFCPFLTNKAWHLRDKLNIDAIRKSAQYFIGTHDFTSFRDTHCQAQSPVRNLELFTIEKQGDVIQATIKAQSFLHHQVRIMMGTLVEIGQGKRKVESINEILRAKNRTQAGVTGKACGLFLVHVGYC